MTNNYLALLREFISLAGFDSALVDHGDTDLISLGPDDELLVIFNKYGTEDLFIISGKNQVEVTFGEWAQTLSGSLEKCFMQLSDLILNILKGEYYVRELRTEKFALAIMVDDETNHVVHIHIPEGEDFLTSNTGKGILDVVDNGELTFNEVRWQESPDDHEENDFSYEMAFANHPDHDEHDCCTHGDHHNHNCCHHDEDDGEEQEDQD